MTWAKNYGDRHGSGSMETGKRAAKIEKNRHKYRKGPRT